MGFVKNYPGQVIYLASTDRKKLTDKVFGITQSLNTAKDGSILPYNILFRLGENGVYQVYIFPRQVEAPSEDRAGLLSNKYGIMEMGGILITYEADEETGEGFFQSQGSEEWRRISRDLMEESLRAASFQNRNFLKHEVLGLKDEAALASSPVGDNYRLTMRASPPKRENDQAMLSAIAFDVKDTRSRNISLVGGKAASLQELASIPGIEVPDGFNVTTTIYNSYLESVNVIDLIGELDEWSVKWNQTENGSVGRREVEQKIQELSNKIQDRILNGVLSREHEVVVKEFYENLDGGQGERLVAVRSSATAEDMPNASFAGQYKTLLNQKGIDQVVQSIKEVWASTFSFNSINYRNKNNIKHGTIKMGVLILEMINPQSAGTMFSVDTETGAPMVSINNTYGLGEAEVSGIVTSDNWIVDPNNLTIIKRRLGDKRVKIVYDPESRKNIEIENDVDKRQRFAANEDTIKELARQMKVVSDYYSSSKEGVEYIDAEYVITNEGGILFTQARPETVWRQGKTSLVAIDKAKAMNFPIILEGGVTGSAGVKTGKVRVVSSVEEAEQKIQFGDVMVAPNTTNIWEHAMGLAGAIITEVGGTGNHTAVVSREQGKPAIVGSAKAMEILQKYEGMEVTIDATEKRIYLGQVPEEFQYFPDKVKPVYGGAYSQTLEESWEEATKTGQTYVDESGERWIGKPKVKVRKFLQEIYRANHQWIADRLKSPIRDKIVDGVYYVNFEDIFRWMGIIKSMSLVELEQLYSERIETVSEFLEKSESLDLTRESVEEWLDVFIRMNAFMGFSFNIYKITEGLLEEELKQKQVPEPYFSKVRQSMSSLLGETEATVRLREYAGLLETLRLPEQYRLVNALKSFRKFQNRDDLKEASPDYYTRLVNYVRNFKVMKNTDAVFSGQVPLNNLVNELLADLGANREIIIVEPTPEEYFPDDPHFQRIARLALLSEKIRQNSHHLKVRGQWKAAMVFQPLASYLIAKGEIDEYEQMFDHKPDWLVDKVAEYEQHNQSQDHDRESFSIRGYHIPNLRRDPRNGTSQKINHATTTMGRWQYTSTTLRNDTLILHNATRIESPYKKEFMINGENKQREIKLNIRQLTPQELDVVQDALVELGIDRDDVRVIRQDLASTDHRLYGLTTKGLIFIREDVLRLGNESSIREALDHLRLKPSGLEYAELKKIQYSGNLRDLITVLSHKTIKQKLLRRFLNANRISRLPDFTDNEQVKKTILRVITDELGEDSDQHEVQLHRVKNESDYYDRITREMVRNMSDFRETLRIVDQLSAENDSAMLSTVQKDRLRQAQELYGLSDVDREYTAQLWAQRLGGRSAAGGQLKIAFELDPEGFPVDDANFVLASMLKKSQREKLLGSYPYADIESDPGNAQAARQTVVTLNSMDGGIGESLNRIAFLREKAKKAGATREEIDAIQMSAKGTDLGYFVTIGGQEEFVSIAEAKVLQVIGFAQQGLYGQMKFQPLVNWQSKGSYEKLLKTVYLYDRLNGKKKPRTYREVLEEGGVEILPMLEQADLPWVEEATGDITLNMDMDDVRYFNLVKLLEEAGDPSAYRRELEKEGIDVLRLYRQILKENDTDIFSIVDLPSAEEKIRHIKFKPENKTSRYRQPGGHGQWGFLFLWKTIQDPAPDDGRSHIRVFYNGDNLNSRVNEHIAGWMARQKLPIVKLTTVATPIDKKGGKDGGKVVEIDGKKVIVPAQMEKADAVAVDQEEIFYSAGQADGLGEQGTQPFNTNVFYINESVLRDIFSELRQIEGYAELESLFRLITPTLIDKDAKKGKDGQRYIPLDGAIGTAMHNLNEFFQTTTDPRVKEILSKRGLDRILFFVDVPRTQFFTPVKNPFDMYLQSHSDYYRFNEKTFSLEDSEPGLIPPEASLAPEKKYWDEYQNLIDAFGRLKLRRLRSLAIEGRVKITDAELKGHVVILNKSQENIDLTQRAELADLKVAGHLVIDNKTIVINEDGSLSVSSTNFSTTTDGAMVSTVGGIDLNEIGMERQGSGSQIYFDSEQLQEIIDAGVTGFAPVIINLTPIHSLLPLLGLEPDDPADRREELYEVSSVN
jgi:phosphohistidine swiveling domain-containing protein